MPYMKTQPLTKVCPQDGKTFEVGGRGRPPKEQVYCSRRCNMLARPPTSSPGTHAPRPKKNKDTLHDEAWLRARYLDERLSTSEIARMVGCSIPSVTWALRKHGIPIRSISEAKRGKPSHTVWTPEMRAAMTESQQAAWESRDHTSKRRGDNYHPDQREHQRRAMRASRRGVTGVAYDAMLATQNGLCLICKKPETSVRADGTVKTLSVDHSHTTGEVRGLLCIRCNSALGMVGDDVATLRAMIAYLTAHA